MRYYKIIDGNYITAIGTGAGGEEITESEYNEIMSVIHSKPVREGYDYKLKTDLTWEEYPVEPPEPDEDMTADEIEEALEGLL